MTDTEDPELITGRRAVYGDPETTFVRIAQVWTGIIGHEIQPHEVPLMMAGLKAVRTQICPDYSDNSDDIDGYIDIFKLLIGENMIHARSVDEYLRIKRERQMGAAPSIPHFTVAESGAITQNVQELKPHDHWPMPHTNICACGAVYDSTSETWSETPNPPRYRHYSDYLQED